MAGRFIWVAWCVCGVALQAQPGSGQSTAERSIRASLSGAGSDVAKCRIEVDVDDVAVVEVFQDQGRLITLSGQPAEWRKMQCTQALPANPADFRFEGVDGRGKVSLQRDPRQNRGMAVVRIEDPKGGREGYTFNLIWRDPNGRSVSDRQTPEQTPIPGYRNTAGYQPGNQDRRWETTVIVCESDNGRRRSCDADTSRGALLLRPRDQAECTLGVTWGYDQRGVWVDRGCRAEFQVAR